MLPFTPMGLALILDPIDHFTSEEQVKIAGKMTSGTKNVEMSFREFCQKLIDAGIGPDDIGIKGYHLARYGDTGGYTVDNCRYVPWYVNLAERRTTSRMIDASKQNVKIAFDAAREKWEQSEEFIRNYPKLTYHPRTNKRSLTPNERQERIKVIHDCYEFMKWGFWQRSATILGLNETTVRTWAKQYMTLHSVNTKG